MAILSAKTERYLRFLFRRIVRTNDSSRQIAGGVAVVHSRASGVWHMTPPKRLKSLS